jgi:hypothetical protein
VVPGVEVASNVSQAAAVLQIGGMILMGAAALCAVAGALLADEEQRGGRIFGYGAAMGSAGMMAIVASTWIAGEDLATVAAAPWMYPLVAFVGFFVYATHLIRTNTRRPMPQRHVVHHPPRQLANRAPLRRRRAVR